MKIYSTNRINALGLKGPEETHKQFPEAEFIEVDNSNIQESEKILYNKAKEIFSNNSLSAKRSISEAVYPLPAKRSASEAI